MNTESPVYVSQAGLICALLGELDRQHPGARINQATMDVVIQSATRIMQAAHAGGLTLPKRTA